MINAVIPAQNRLETGVAAVHASRQERVSHAPSAPQCSSGADDRWANDAGIFVPEGVRAVATEVNIGSAATALTVAPKCRVKPFYFTSRPFQRLGSDDPTREGMAFRADVFHGDRPWQACPAAGCKLAAWDWEGSSV